MKKRRLHPKAALEEAGRRNANLQYDGVKAALGIPTVVTKAVWE